MQLDQNAQNEIIQQLSEKLKCFYIFPEIAEQICARLELHLANGDYTGITEGDFFALALTEHLQEVNHDEHLWVRWYPEVLPDHEGSMLQNQERLVEFKQQAKLKNYGIHKVERLPGNVGYVDIRYFYNPSWGSGETAVSAMQFLANMNAIIIDLCKCQGGNPGMVALMCSYFFEGNPIHLNSLYWRDEDFTQQYWTLPFVPGKRFEDTPVYVLTSADTFSAGEEFAYNLKTRQRATLVGEATGGGAHPGSPYRIHPHFEVFIPVGRAINPITNDNWEGSGVQPDVPVSSAEALDAAYKLALEGVILEISELEDRPSVKLLEEVHAALKDLDSGHTSTL